MKNLKLLQQEKWTNSICIEVESSLPMILVTLDMLTCLGCLFRQKRLTYPSPYNVMMVLLSVLDHDGLVCFFGS